MWSRGCGYLKRPLDSGTGGGEGRKKRIVEGKGEEEEDASRDIGGGGALEGFPLMGTYVENSLAMGYLSTFPREIEFQEEGLNTLESLG